VKKILGLDLGIASVGWGIINDQYEVIASGVRLYEEANSENNAKRRSQRSMRRLKRRKTERIKRVKQYLIDMGLIDISFKPLSNPYQLRVKGLTEALSSKELATVLLHIAKRRGSSLETVEGDVSSNEQSPKTILSKHDKELEIYGYISKIQVENLRSLGKIRGIQNVYRLSDYVDEALKIMKNSHIDESHQHAICDLIQQRRHYSHGPGSRFSPSPYGRFRELNAEEKTKVMSALKQSVFFGDYNKKTIKFEYENEYFTILKDGRVINYEPLNLIEMMRGHCSVYPNELRAPKKSPSAELFNVLNDLNNIKITNREEQKITVEEKNKIIETLKTKGDFTPKGIKGLAKLLVTDIEHLEGLRIDSSDKKIISSLEGFNKFRKIFQTNTQIIGDFNVLDRISEILTSTNVISERQEQLNQLGLLSNSEIEQCVNLTGFSQYHALSLKAIYELNTEMLLTSLNQQQIIVSRNQEDTQQKPSLDFTDEILNPVARRTQHEAMKVVIELIHEFGPFDDIIIETTRSKNSKEEANQIKKQQKKNKEQRDEVIQLLVDSGYQEDQINSQLILKLRLYNEQQGKCAYSGSSIDINRLIKDPHAYEIDHIIPYSISLDDSFYNKVLVLSDVNQLKGNRTPFAYFLSGKVYKNGPIQTFEQFRNFVQSNGSYEPLKKKQLLIEKSLTRFEEMEEFINRNLNDTSYAIRVFMSKLKSYLSYYGYNTKVKTIKGKQTNLFRKIGIQEWQRKYQTAFNRCPLIKDRKQHMHHAIDALIIAGLSQQKIFNFYYSLQAKDDKIINRYTGELFEYDPMGDSQLIKYLLTLSKIESSQIRFSWKRDSKPNRRFSDETIYSTRLIDNEDVVVKKHKNIYELDNEKLESIFYDEKKKTKLLIYKHDPKTFDIMKSIYDQYKHEKYPFKVYKDNHGPIRKYAKNNQGPEITSMKYLEDNLGNHMAITHKYTGGIDRTKHNKKVVMLQVSGYRIDIYANSNNQYRFVTVRYIHLKKSKNEYYIPQDIYQKLKEDKGIDDSYKFKFSLYRNDLFEVIKVDKNGESQLESYRLISVANDSTNKIETQYVHAKPDKRIMISIGKSIQEITKYNVSPAGRKQRVINEDLLLKIN